MKQNFSAREFVEKLGSELPMNEEEKLAFHNDAKNRYRIILELLPQNAKRILEVGAGSGLLTFLLREWSGGEVHALDLHACRREWRKGEWVEIQRCNVEEENFPFPSESFDCVVCSEVLEHLLFSPYHMLTETHRVLREGGTLILTTPNAVKLIVRLKVLLGKELCHYRSFYSSSPSDRHIKEYTPSEVRELLIQHGFKVEKLLCRNTTSLTGPISRYRGRRRLLVNLCLAFSLLWPSFREIIFVKAKKIS
ncbi:MAG: class I SAM-dependent methyltransferase [Candidatus Hadarchaeales archaeon]